MWCDPVQLTPVNFSVGLIKATDIDSEPLFYRLESATVRTSPFLQQSNSFQTDFVEFFFEMVPVNRIPCRRFILTFYNSWKTLNGIFGDDTVLYVS